VTHIEILITIEQKMRNIIKQNISKNISENFHSNAIILDILIKKKSLCQEEGEFPLE